VQKDKKERKPLVDRVLEWVSEHVSLHVLVNMFTTLTGFLYGEMDERLEIRAAIKKQMRKPIPGRITWWGCFGGITFLLFMIQIVTGVLLAIYYRPTTGGAYESIMVIMNNVSYGWLIRSIHRYASELMIVTIIIHMAKVFLTAAYKPPREMNWMIGVFLFIMTVTFGFTGYLLPWDQRAFWATTVGTEIANSVPLAGKYIAFALRGGETVGQPTLTRFFAVHVIILPWVLTMFLMMHFLIIRRQGISDAL